MDSSTTKALSERRILYIILLVLLFVGPNIPLIVPIPLEPWVQDFYNVIETLRPGDNVLLHWGISTKADVWDIAPLTVEHIIKKGANIIWVDRSVEAGPLGQELRIYLWGSDWKNNPTGSLKGYKYGTRFTYMGYLSEGGTVEEGTVSMLQNFQRTFAVGDAFGTLLSQLPTVSKLRDVRDIKVHYGLGGWSPDTTPRQMEILMASKVPILSGGTATMLAGRNMNLYVIKQLAGMVGGVRNAAEYAFLTGTPSKAMGYMVTLILCALVLITGVLGRNLLPLLRGEKPVTRTSKKEGT